MNVISDQAKNKYDAIVLANEDELGMLHNEIEQLTSDYNDLSTELSDKRKQLSKFNVRNLKRREELHRDRVNELKQQIYDMKSGQGNHDSNIAQLERETTELRNKLEAANEKIQVLGMEKHNFQKKNWDLKKRVKEKSQKLSDEVNKVMEERDLEWLKFKEQCKANQRLQTLLDLCEGNEIQAFENGKYTNDVREVVLGLHKLHIPIRAIAPSIKLIIEKLTNETVSRLPEYGTIHKIMYEGRCLALLEAGRAMLRDKKSKEPANVLMNDGTTKLKRKYNATIVGTSEGQKSIGLKLFAAENADTLLEANKESLSEVAEIVASVENKEKEDVFSDTSCATSLQQRQIGQMS